MEKDTEKAISSDKGEIILYRSPDTDTIGLHIRNIYKEGELTRKGTTEESSVVQNEGGRPVRRKVGFYNLDVIISLFQLATGSNPNAALSSASGPPMC